MYEITQQYVYNQNMFRVVYNICNQNPCKMYYFIDQIDKQISLQIRVLQINILYTQHNFFGFKLGQILNWPKGDRMH